jgi:hypothetical protein
MKIGLLTFHSAHNYGAVLQAYATQEKVKELGHHIEVIQYNPDYLIKQKLFPVSKNNSLVINIKLIAEGLITFSSKLLRRKKFEKFITNKLQLSAKQYFSKPFQTNLDYDIFIMGSDQIWNCKLTKGFDKVYLGNFEAKPTTKKITYAASMSHYDLTDVQSSEFATLIENFDQISVREEDLQEFLSKNYHKNSTIVVDPTFLLNAEKWSAMAEKPKTDKKYVLVYSVDLRNDALRIAQNIAKEIQAEVIELSMNVDKNGLKNKYQTASPEAYVGLFEKAAFVVTSSFHGTAFSVIFNKPFYSIAHGSDKDSRQKTILKSLGVLDRFIAKDSNPSFKTLDYTIPNQKLNVLREKSIAFFKKNISKA